MNNGDVILEFHQIGQSVKVSAIDASSMVEISIVGAPSLGKEALKRVALQKLAYVMRRKGMCP